jgi:hypothetical protein
MEKFPEGRFPADESSVELLIPNKGDSLARDQRRGEALHRPRHHLLHQCQANFAAHHGGLLQEYSG